MKTLKDYENSNVKRDEFLNPFDEIDEALHEDICCGEVAPHASVGEYSQNGECDKQIDGVYFYETVKSVRTETVLKFYYMGILPCMNGCCYD